MIANFNYYECDKADRSWGVLFLVGQYTEWLRQLRKQRQELGVYATKKRFRITHYDSSKLAIG